MFQAPESEKSTKVSDEEKNKAQMLRENIIRTMNEVRKVYCYNYKSIVAKETAALLYFPGFQGTYCLELGIFQ